MIYISAFAQATVLGQELPFSLSGRRKEDGYTMNTILAIALVSLYILAPMVTALAVAVRNTIGMVAGVVAIVVFSVSFWMSFGLYATSNATLFAFAAMWQVFSSVSAVYKVADELDII